jgi:hypothetical protein
MNKQKRQTSGLGYCRKSRQYFTITYGWEYLRENIIDSDTRDIKSGITGLSGKEAMITSKRHQDRPKRLIWETKHWIDKGTSKKVAINIVQLMDYRFKKTMEAKKLDLRQVLKTNDIGSEHYQVDVNGGVEFIQDLWSESFSSAHKLYTKVKPSLFDPNNFIPKGFWFDHLQRINFYYTMNDKGRFLAPTAYGKSYLGWFTAYVSDRGKKSPIKVFYVNNINNTQQLASQHLDYENGVGDVKYVVCSDERDVVNKRYGKIEAYAVSNGKLKMIVESAIKNNESISFYVNKDSAGGFNDIVNELISKYQYQNEVVTIIDEIQEFTGKSYMKKSQAISNPIKNSWLFGMTATEERKSLSDDRTDIVWNNNVDMFGNVIEEVTPAQALERGRMCPIDFITLVTSGNDDLTEIIYKNKPLVAKLSTKRKIEIRGRLLRALAAVVYAIAKGKKKIISLNSMTRDAEDMMECLEIMKREGQIPNDYEIVSGLRKHKKENLPYFREDVTKGIYVGTPWLVTGTDIPSVDCGIVTYDFGKERVAQQWAGRMFRVDDKNPTKRALIIITKDYNNTLDWVKLEYVRENMISDANTHQYSVCPKDKKTNSIFGSRIKKLITAKMVVGQGNDDAEKEFFWSEVKKAIKGGDFNTLDKGKIRKNYLFTTIEQYKTLSDLIKHNIGLFNRLESYEQEYGIDFYNNFTDYKSLPNDYHTIVQFVRKKFNNLQKNFDEQNPYYLMGYTKIRHIAK